MPKKSSKGKQTKKAKVTKITKKPAKTHIIQRPATLTLACILLALSAAINLFVFSQVVFFIDPSELLLLGENTKLLGMIAGVLALLDVLALYGLWHMKKYGAVVGILDMLASILIGFYPQPSFEAIPVVMLVFNVAVLVLIALNWSKLK